jgi:DNA-binding winged helix-turn-helix (wHTH) protein
MQRLWPDTFVDETSLTSNISVLRKTLSAEGGSRPYVETVPKRGYRFVAPVAVIEDAVTLDRVPQPGGLRISRIGGLSFSS